MGTAWLHDYDTLHGGIFADVRRETQLALRAFVSCGFCKEDSAPRGFPQSVLVCIQVGLGWITAVAACEDKLVCTCEGVCKKGGLREVICSPF